MHILDDGDTDLQTISSSVLRTVLCWLYQDNQIVDTEAGGSGWGVCLATVRENRKRIEDELDLRGEHYSVW